MSLSADTLRRLAALKLSPSAMGEVLSIIADLQEKEETRKSKERTRKARGKSAENPGNGHGISQENDTENPGQKEIPPTPPKEKTLSQEPNGSFESRPKRVRTVCSPEFEDFWKAYPTTPIMAKKAAWVEWQKLSSEDQLAAGAAVDGFKTWLRSKPDHAIVHACRFLSQRRFDGFADNNEPGEAANSGFHADQESPQYEAWKAFKRQTKHDWAATDKTGGWTFPTEWPPNPETGQ